MITSSFGRWRHTRVRLTTAHRPQGNGQAETINKELVTKLKIYCSSYPYDWDVKVHHLAYAYNTTVHSVTGETPFFCMHGYHPSSAYTLYLTSLEGPAQTRGVASEVARFRSGHALALKKAYSRLVLDAQRRQSAAMPPLHRIPGFKVGDSVSLSVVHCSSDEFDTKLSPRFVGPFQITAVPHPYVYTVDFGFKYPHIHPRVNADLLRLFMQPSACSLRTGESDYPLVGDANRPIETLLARRSGRGRPPRSGRPSYQYKVQFRDLDAMYDVWITERQLRDLHPETAPTLIADCDATYQPS